VDVLITTAIIVPLVVLGFVGLAVMRVRRSKHRRWVRGLEALRELPDQPGEQPEACNWRVVPPGGQRAGSPQ